MTKDTHAALADLRAQITSIITITTDNFVGDVNKLQASADAIAKDKDFPEGVREEARKIALALAEADIRIVRAASA